MLEVMHLRGACSFALGMHGSLEITRITRNHGQRFVESIATLTPIHNDNDSAS